MGVKVTSPGRIEESCNIDQLLGPRVLNAFKLLGAVSNYGLAVRILSDVLSVNFPDGVFDIARS